MNEVIAWNGGNADVAHNESEPFASDDLEISYGSLALPSLTTSELTAFSIYSITEREVEMVSILEVKVLEQELEIQGLPSFPGGFSDVYQVDLDLQKGAPVIASDAFLLTLQPSDYYSNFGKET